MAVTTDQYNRILSRLVALENMMNDLVVVSKKHVTLSQVQQLHTLLQTEIIDLMDQVTALEARVTTIEDEPQT